MIFASQETLKSSTFLFLRSKTSVRASVHTRALSAKQVQAEEVLKAIYVALHLVLGNGSVLLAKTKFSMVK